MLVLVSEVIFYFNPRSLTGATVTPAPTPLSDVISIHAPSRERQVQKVERKRGGYYFNPRSLTGATFRPW